MPALIGRRAELARISTLLGEIRAGRGAALALHGEPGIGKTALLESAAAQAHGIRVLRATGIESELELAFSGLAELCLPLLGRLDEIPEPQANALRAAFALADGRPGDRFVLALATASLLHAEAHEQPVLALIDDAQWLDRASADALTFMIRRLHGGRIGTLVAARSGEFDLHGVETIALAGLSEESALTLLADREDLAPEVATRLVALTGGNPLALREIAAGLAAEELSGRSPLQEPPRLGPSLERVFARRLDHLTSEARETLLLASVGAAHPLSAIAGRLSAGGLAEAEDRGFIRIVGDSIVFRHPLVRSAVYHSAVPSAQRAAHRTLAGVLDGEAGAWHLAAAVVGLDEDAAQALEHAGTEAQNRSGYGPAAAAFRRAAELTGEREARARRLSLAAEAAAEAGLVALASEAIEAAERIGGDPRRQAELGYLRGLLLIHAGEDATAAFASAGRSIAPDDAERGALMLAWASEAAIYRRRWSDAHRLAAEASELVEGSGSVAEFWSTWMQGVALTMLGRSQKARAALQEAILVFLRNPSYADDPRLLANFSVALMYRDDFTQGVVAAERAAAAARRQGAFPTMLFASSFELVARVVLGEWDRARDEAAELHAIALDIDNRSELDDFVWTQAYVAAARGDADRLASLSSLVDPRRDPRVALCGGLLALGRDAPGDAIAALSQHVTAGARAGYADPDMSPFDLAEALIRVGEQDKADALLRAYEPMQRCSWVAAGLARCRGLAGKEGFEALYVQSRAALDAIGFVFEVGRTDLYLGETLRRHRRRGEARAPLARALAAFERLDALPWAERARAGLRAAGAATEVSVRPVHSALSERERQIAVAAAAGKTNREIAGELFLSHRTVELHLAAVFRKLGIRRRTELAPLIGPAPAPDHT
jgi:DNA-binding CsgD family transcriptional regulator